VFRSPQKRASEHIAIARRNSPLQNAASGQACSAVIRNDQFLIPPEIPPSACSSGFCSSLLGGVPTVQPSVRVVSECSRTPLLLARLGFGAVCPSVRVFLGKPPPGAHGGAGNQRRPFRLGRHGYPMWLLAS